MDSSSRRSSSTSSTPLDADAQLKRAREEELDAYLAVPPNKRMETSPCTTPIHSPEHMGGAAMVQSTPIASCNIGTPLAGHRPSGAAELGLRWAFSQRQGPRNGQEDRIACKFDEGHNCNGHSLRHAYFGVFDGHGGDEASQWCADSLHTNVLGSPHFPEALVSALHDGFLRTDADWLARAAMCQRKKESNAGTAAVVMMVTSHELVLAHAGDCRAILVRRAGSGLAPFVELTSDHTAEEALRPDELRRVEAAGGECEAGYVYISDHNLPMTRALGDLRLKVAQGRCWQETPACEQVVTAVPEVGVHARSADDLCVVLASDGLFGSVMSSEQVASCVLEDFEKNAHTGHAEELSARRLSQLAISNYQSADNVSVVVVGLEPPRAQCSSSADEMNTTCARSASVEALGEVSVGPHPSSTSDDSVRTTSTECTLMAHSPCAGRSIADKLRLPLNLAYPPRTEGCLNPPPLRERNTNIDHY